MDLREELAREIFAADNYRAPDPYGLWDETNHGRLQYSYVIADGLIAKGYGKLVQR